MYSKTCPKGPLKKNTKIGFQYRLMQVKSIAECSAILSTFIKLPFSIKTFVLSTFKCYGYVALITCIFLHVGIPFLPVVNGIKVT